jgi:hypothetical protein
MPQGGGAEDAAEAEEPAATKQEDMSRPNTTLPPITVNITQPEPKAPARTFMAENSEPIARLRRNLQTINEYKAASLTLSGRRKLLEERDALSWLKGNIKGEN